MSRAAGRIPAQFVVCRKPAPQATGLVPTRPGKSVTTAKVPMHRLLAMPDSHVLDYDDFTGQWRLWNHDPHASDILPGSSEAQVVRVILPMGS